MKQAAKVVKAGGVASLMDVLKKGNKEGKAAAGQAIIELFADPNNHPSIVKAGGIQARVQPLIRNVC